jgi:hypothetical protein
VAEQVATLTAREQVLGLAVAGIRDRVEATTGILSTVPAEAITERAIIGVKLLQMKNILDEASAQFWFIVRRHHELPDEELQTDLQSVYLAEDKES